MTTDRTLAKRRRLAALGLGVGLLLAGTLVAGVRSPATATAEPMVARPTKPLPAAAVVKPAPSPAPAPEPDRFVVKRILAIDGPMRQGDYHWDETGAPAGQVVVTIDLAAQTLSIFRGGYEIGTAVIIYGADEKPTPLGIFPITQKDAAHVSNLYHAPMPYMLRLTNDGVSVHGSEVGDGYVTHGCIGIPKPFAKRLFAAVKLGDKVIVTRGETLGVGDPITAA